MTTDRPPPEPLTLLLVDDRNENLVALTAILAAPSYRLLTARSGKEALRIALREHLAVIVLDVLMPEIDGFEVARMLKQLERTRNIPILFLTAQATDVRQIYRAYEVGAVDYLVKPLDPEVVRKKVAVFADLTRQREQIERQARELLAAQGREHELRIAELTVAGDRRYRKLVEGIDSAIGWTAEEPGRLTFVSRQAPQILGFPLEEFSRPGFWDRHVHPEDREALAALFRTAMTTQGDASLEHRMIAGDGRVRWFHTSVSGEASTIGPAQLHGISIEITEIKRSEEAQALLADVGSILAESLDYRITLPNLARRLVPLLGDWCVIDVAADSVSRGVAVAHAVPEREPPLAALDRRPHRLSVEAPELCPESSELAGLAKAIGLEEPERLRQLNPGSYMLVPMRARGRILGVVILVATAPRRLDTGELALAEQIAERTALVLENALLYDEARRATRAREDLLAVVSHDLRNPLAAISMSASQLAGDRDREPEPERVRERAQRILRSAKLMERLIGDLLEFASSDPARVSIDDRAYDASLVVRDSVELLEPLAIEKGIHLEVRVGEIINVRCDRDRIVDVLSNLIGNAIKFTPNGGSVVVRVEELEREARFAVCDTGPGIAPDDLPRIWERFWRTDKPGSGLGLGLAISKRLVEAQHGAIWADSQPGAGTTFYFTLPLAKAVAEAEPAAPPPAG